MVLSTSLSAAVINETSTDLDATFVDNGYYHTDTTTDTTTDIEWLDFSNFIGDEYVGSTMGYSINDNIDWFKQDGWEFATYTEVDGLFDLFFGDLFVDSGNGTMGLTESETDAMIQARNTWLYSFGIDADLIDNGDSSYTLDSNLYSLGMYEAQDGIQLLGIDLLLNPLSSTIYGPDYQTGLNLTMDTVNPNLGVFMVRNVSVVPIPPAIWLFGAGIGLIVVARRKHK